MKIRLLTIALVLLGAKASAQEWGQIHGNLNVDAQYYNEDSVIGAQVPPEQMGFNVWGNVVYTRGNFSAGVRFESYEPSLLGYPAGQTYDGSGIGYRYLNYRVDKLEVTLGNFFEQFGSGMVFRSFEERGLGVDNAMDGVRLKYNAGKGIYLKGLVGKQRLGFENGFTTGPGIVRALDAELSLNEICTKLADKGANLILGGSFVSKYQEDKDPLLNLPENVGAWAGRARYTSARWNIYAEYAQKINDPNLQNGFIYKNGRGMLVEAVYTIKGFGMGLGAHTFDNMSFQSDRAAPTAFDLNINFLPALAKQHTYNLAATLYPYATQPNGEVAFQGDVFYKFKKGSKLGGKYGTKISVNYSVAYNLDSTAIQNDEMLEGYKTNFFSPGEDMYFSDLNIEVRKKFKNKSVLIATYFNQVYDIDVVQGKPGKPKIYSDIIVLDYSKPINKKHNIRVELQHLSTKQDLGNWATALIEYTISPGWFFAVMDQYNYGGSVDVDDLHYPIGTVGYTKGGNRFQLGYGRQREGIFCVGGVCRQVPAANGLTLSVTSTF